jgi:hypothetical protein
MMLMDVGDTLGALGDDKSATTRDLIMSRQAMPVLLLWSVLGLWMTGHATCRDPADPSELGKPSLPGKPCTAFALAEWTSQERWVWEQVCEGRIADFNIAEGGKFRLDPEKSDGWTEKRVLRQIFLETILLYEPWREKVPRQGIRISGAWFKEPLNLSNAEMKHTLVLHCSRFEAHVILLSLHTTRVLSFEESALTADLIMSDIRVEDSLFMRHAEFTNVRLRAAHIGDQLNLIDATVNGKLTMESLEVEGPLLMRQVKIAERDSAKWVDLAFMDIGGTLDLSGSQLPSLDLTGSHIGGELRLAQEQLVARWQPEATLILRNVTAGAMQDAHNAWPGTVELGVEPNKGT